MSKRFCRICGDEHGGKRCREYSVFIETVGYTPKLSRSESITARDEAEARTIIMGWAPEDMSLERWSFRLGNRSKSLCITLDEVPYAPWPTRWKVTDVADVTPERTR